MGSPWHHPLPQQPSCSFSVPATAHPASCPAGPAALAHPSPAHPASLAPSPFIHLPHAHWCQAGPKPEGQDGGRDQPLAPGSLWGGQAINKHTNRARRDLGRGEEGEKEGATRRHGRGPERTPSTCREVLPLQPGGGGASRGGSRGLLDLIYLSARFVLAARKATSGQGQSRGHQSGGQ